MAPVTSGFAVVGKMSEYYSGLDESGKKRYKQKLEAVGLTLEDDPYAPKNQEKFVNDMSKRPKLEFGHVFTYFIKRPGVFTMEQLLSWKQLEAYNYFQNGHVRTVFCLQLESPCGRLCLMKAFVNPSQSSPDKAHDTWIVVKMDGEVVSAHCTCKAG